jgi:predicted transposase YbfD/YdcC
MAEKTCGLRDALQTLTDPRRQCANLKHLFHDVLVLGFCGTVAGCDDFVEIAAWASHHEASLRTFLDLPNGIPSHDTFTRVFAMVSTPTLQAVLVPWLQQRRGLPDDSLLHIDGKAMRRTRDKQHGLGPLIVVSAWASAAGLTLGQVAVNEKSNEITAIPELLQLLDLQDKVVTIDAAGCQKNIAADIKEQGGDYVLAVKDNQPTLHAEIATAFALAAQAERKPASAVTTEEGHGRQETRTVQVLPAKKLATQQGLWAGLAALVMVIREVACKSTGKITREVSYYISSLKPNAKTIGHAIRSHWSIENGLHWVLDVVFKEDAKRIYDRQAAENVAFLDRLALSLLRGDPTRGSLKVKRKRASWSVAYLMQLLGF